MRKILILIIIIASFLGLMLALKKRPQPPTSTEGPVQDGSTLLRPLQPSDINTSQLFLLVNQNREQNNLADLVRDPRLDASALAKCQDMVSKNYWSHYSPSGVGINEWIVAQGVPFIHFGENLATGESSAQQVDNDWMNSPEHKTNILDGRFTSVGYSVCISNNFTAHNTAALVIVQHFAQE